MKKKSAAKKKTAPKRSAKAAAPARGFGQRNVLFRPDRFKYVRKVDRPAGCVFCRSAGGLPSFETLCVYQSEHSQVVLNKFPYNSGHVLVLPKRHCGNILELSEAESADLWKTLNKTMEVMQLVYQPGGVNMGLNHGSAAGAGLPDHLHFHVIPRWAGDLNFFPLIADTKVVVESLEDSYAKISKGFEGTSK